MAVHLSLVQLFMTEHRHTDPLKRNGSSCIVWTNWGAGPIPALVISPGVPQEDQALALGKSLVIYNYLIRKGMETLMDVGY